MSSYRRPCRGAFKHVMLRSNRLSTISSVSIFPSTLNNALTSSQRQFSLLPSRNFVYGIHSNVLLRGNCGILMNDKRTRNEGTEEFSYRFIGQSTRLFSTTAKPFSRKKPIKKPTEADIDATNNAIDASEPLLSFNYQATLGIIQIARAVAPIVSMNEGYILTANYDLRTDAFELAGQPEPLQLELKTNGKGSYLFTIDRPTERINLVSPMSGSHSYFFDQEEQLWLSMNTDRHDLRGLVTRDLLRHARGLATF